MKMIHNITLSDSVYQLQNTQKQFTLIISNSTDIVRTSQLPQECPLSHTDKPLISQLNDLTRNSPFNMAHIAKGIAENRAHGPRRMSCPLSAEIHTFVSGETRRSLMSSSLPSMADTSLSQVT